MRGRQATILQFADQNRLKLRRDECNDPIIPGRRGQIYDWGNGRLGVMYSNGADLTSERWNARRKTLLAAGFTITQNAEREGCATFDPDNLEQAKLAIQMTGIKRRREVSETQLARLRPHSFKGTRASGASGALETRDEPGRVSQGGPIDFPPGKASLHGESSAEVAG